LNGGTIPAQRKKKRGVAASGVVRGEMTMKGVTKNAKGKVGKGTGGNRARVTGAQKYNKTECGQKSTSGWQQRR